MPNLLRAIPFCLIACSLFGLTPTLQAAIVLTQVAADGKPIAGLPSAFDMAKPLSIASSTRSLSLEFDQTNEEGKTSDRLRYKLEGYDRNWQDLLSNMRGFLEFHNSSGDVLGTEEFYLKGETPGWRGSPETSDFVEYTRTCTAPEGSCKVEVVLMSHGPNATMGVVGFDAIRLSVVSPGSSTPKVYELNAEGIHGFPQPSDPSAFWDRGGSRASLAEVRIMNTPAPHPILVFNDDAPSHYATWVTRWNKPLEVKPGDQVTLSFKAAYSIGSGGPGVAEFPQLQPGNYFFRAVATRADGEPNGAELVLPLVITAPWYRHMGFWVALSVVMSAGVAWFSRWSLKRRMQMRLAALEHERAMERERERIARDLHDHIGAGLTEIAMQSDWVDGDLEQGVTQRTRQRVKAIRQSATDLARGVDEMVWAINPANDSLKRFANYLAQCSAQFLEAAGVRVRFDIPADLPEIPLPGKLRHALFLVVLEAINNAVKYARATLVRLELQVGQEGLHLAIEDDGQGFDLAGPSPEGSHEGLNNMRHRMDEIGGAFSIAS